jgi:hypothetical protein
MLDTNNFEFFSDRLRCIDITNDPMLNLELWHSLGEFEAHVYGVVLQYTRISSVVKIASLDNIPHAGLHQARLDAYYYILTWDKLGKIYHKIKAALTRFRQSNPAFPAAFWPKFRILSKKIELLFSEFAVATRNEYEHPSLKAYRIGSMIMWGSMTASGSGDMSFHVGADAFATVRKEHCEKLLNLRTDLIDLLLSHFSQAPLTRELLKIRQHIEANVESIAAQLKRFRDSGDADGFNDLFGRFTTYDLYLSREAVPLAASVRDQVHSVLIDNTSCAVD